MGEFIPSQVAVTELRAAFLSHPILSQFKTHPNNLIVDIPEKGCARLYLTAFLGLVKEGLEMGNLHALDLENFRVYEGHLMAGGPEGISIQYKYETC